MSVSQHPVALRLEEWVGGPTKLLATVMALPLIDGIFPALVIAGALNSTVGIIETGLLIFGGSATMAVVLAEMEGTPRERVIKILLIGAVVVPVAALEASVAATLDSILNLEIFTRFAGVVILAVAAKTASSKVGEFLPSPAVIIGLGLVASVQPDGASLQIASDLFVVATGAAAAATGVLFAAVVALMGPHLRGRVDLDRFRFGSAVALGVLALPILGLLQTEAPIALAVLLVTGLLSYDPDGEASKITREDHPGTSDTPDGTDITQDRDEVVGGARTEVADGGTNPATSEDPPADDRDYADDKARAPWL
jgi:hypothetical protein